MSQTAVHLVDRVIPHVPVRQSVLSLPIPLRLLQTAITRLMKLLTRRGVLVEDMGQAYLAEPDADGDEARTLRPLQATAVTYRIAFGPRGGQKVLTLRGAIPREGQYGSRCAPTSMASVCTPRYVCKHTSASGRSSCAATSRGRRFPTSGCRRRAKIEALQIGIGPGEAQVKPGRRRAKGG